jgi:glycosyltransferase involved in cell wall biosynthesis
MKNDLTSKICIIIPSVKSGGIENYVLRYLKFSSEKITIVVRNKRHRGELLEKFQSEGVLIYFRPLGYFNPLNIIWYWRFFIREKFDSVCDFNANFSGLTILIAKISGVKKRVSFYRQSSHHFNQTTLKLLYAKFVNWLVYKFATKILANSKTAIAYYFKSYNTSDGRFFVLNNGYDMGYFRHNYEESLKLKKALNLPLKKKIIGHVGRYSPVKNHEVMIKVMHRIFEENLDFHFIFVGKSTKKILAHFDNKYQINITCIDYAENIPVILGMMDLFWFPSVTEGQPNALIEAILCEIPFICSNIEAIKEIFDEQDDIVYFDPLDEEEIFHKIQNEKSFVFQNNLYEKMKSKFEANTQFEKFRNLL